MVCRGQLPRIPVARRTAQAGSSSLTDSPGLRVPLNARLARKVGPTSECHSCRCTSSVRCAELMSAATRSLLASSRDSLRLPVAHLTRRERVPTLGRECAVRTSRPRRPKIVQPSAPSRTYPSHQTRSYGDERGATEVSVRAPERCAVARGSRRTRAEVNRAPL